jgi:hypothetical protein
MGPVAAGPYLYFRKEISERGIYMEKKEKWLRIVLTAATVILLAVLAWQCLDIYLTGNSAANLDEKGLYVQSVYRAEDVIQRLSGLGIWVMGYLALLFASCFLLPEKAGAGKSLPMEPDNRLRLMKQRLTELPEEARKEVQLRKKICFAAGGVVVLCAGLCLVYLMNRENFVSWDLEMVMGRMLMHTLPWVIAAFAVVIGATFVCRRSMEREIQLLKGIPGGEAPEAAAKPSCVNYVRVALYAVAVVLILLGINNGGMRDVLVKAINICTECIGLG